MPSGKSRKGRSVDGQAIDFAHGDGGYLPPHPPGRVEDRIEIHTGLVHFDTGALAPIRPTAERRMMTLGRTGALGAVGARGPPTARVPFWTGNYSTTFREGAGLPAETREHSPSVT